MTDSFQYPSSFTLSTIELTMIDAPPKKLRPLDPKRVETMKKTLMNLRIPPITVRPAPSGRYTLLDGHHRLEAARQLQLREISAVLVECDEQDAVGIAITNNMNRKDLTGPELAAAAKALQNAGGTTLRPGLRILADLLGTSHTRLKRTIKASRKLAPECRAAYESGQIKEDSVNELVKLPPPEQVAMLEDAKSVKTGTLKRDEFRSRVGERRRGDVIHRNEAQEQRDVHTLPKTSNPCWMLVEFEKSLSPSRISMLGSEDRRDLLASAKAAAVSANRLIQVLSESDEAPVDFGGGAR